MTEPLLERIPENVDAILNSTNTLLLATKGISIHTERVHFEKDSYNIFCTITELQTKENILNNPRVAFLIEDGKGQDLHGNGIARLTQDKTNYSAKISPYRFNIKRNDSTEHECTTIEKKRLKWTTIESLPKIDDLSESKTKTTILFWLRATRAISLPLSILPVAIGTALASINGNFANFNFWLFLLALSASVLVHLGTNLISDYNDFKKGIDTTDALSSHTGALVNELIEPEHILYAAFIVLAAATFAGGTLTGILGWPILIFGLIGIMGGIFYTGGFIGYKYRGLGEFTIAFLMGPLVIVGAFFVQTRTITLLPVVVSIPVGLLVGSVTLANNLRDIIDDRESGILTLPMRIGIKNSKLLYLIMIATPYVIVVVSIIINLLLYPLILALLSIPQATVALKAMDKTKNTAEDFRAKAHIFKYPLNSIKLHLQFSIFLLVGIIIIPILKILL